MSFLLSSVPTLGAFFVVDAFQQTDWVGKSITIGLLGLSFYLLAIFVNKYFALCGYKSYNIVFLRAYEGHPHPGYLYLDPRGLISGSPIGAVYMEGMAELLRVLREHGVADADLRNWKPGEVRKVLTPTEVEAVRSACARRVAKQQLVLESKMSRIATSISTAPSVGLFGTVWGVMGAFMAMSNGGSSMIANVAPGISGALLTTVAGLLVAIPTTVGYNILTGMIRRHVVELENFADSFMMDVVQLHEIPDEPSASAPAPAPAVAAGQVALVLPAASVAPAAPAAAPSAPAAPLPTPNAL